MGTPKNIPIRYNQALGDVSVERGKTRNQQVRLYSWDAINDCQAENCVAYQFCRYDKKGKCTIQANYLRAFSDVMFTNFAASFTEGDFYYIGMHMMPLYKTLCKLKIEELAVTRVINVDEKGVRRVNPVYKEIRETIKLINSLWKSMGMTKGPAPIPGDPDFPDDEDDGVIEGEVESPMASKKKGLVRRK